MGLSASQTRFLTLTARKSNVEYQGQQINQARTALANQSADLFTQMMTLQAPTAPSVYDYAVNPATKPMIDWQTAVYPLGKAAEKNFDAYYSYNSPKFSDFNIPEYKKTANADGSITWALKEADANGNMVFNNKYKQYENGTWARIEKNEDGSTTEVALPESPLGTYCVHETGKYANGKEASYIAMYVADSAGYKYNAADDLFYIPQEASTGVILPDWIKAYNRASSQYRTYSKPTSTKIYETGVTVTDTTTAVAYTRTPSVTAEDAQYNQAMEQYKKDLAEYERTLEIINAKCDEIHEADKKLELQLKQLEMNI